ncbi:MAG: hypothetical protein OET90_01360 [Desulfuromonadales bacterium]|nr:hypothetical protein [Desulfuromonadales bacterium]
MTNKNSIDGVSNIIAGRDVEIRHFHNDPARSFQEIFDSADQKFKIEVNEKGALIRLNKIVSYSSKELFTSLMQIGIPFDTSITVPFKIIPFLKEIAANKTDVSIVTSADIRIAVVNVIGGFSYFGKHSEEEVAMWCAAYVRRYGNPENQFVKVIDNGKEKDLNYNFVKKTIIPHLLERIIDLEKFSNPIGTFPDIFSNQTVDKMSGEIVRLLNTLNVYNIRYKTVINLLQDIIVEPPHPWLVSPNLTEKVCQYNLERATFHHTTLRNPLTRNAYHLFNRSAQETLMHFSAAILANYGSFLGVGSKYGLLELRRVLGLKKGNPSLWTYCRISQIEPDLVKVGITLDVLYGALDRMMHVLHEPDSVEKFDSLLESALWLESLCTKLSIKGPNHTMST